MQPAVNIRIGFGVSTRNRIDDGLRFLGRRAVVEIDQRFAVDLARKNGKIRADRFYIIQSSDPYLIDADP